MLLTAVMKQAFRLPSVRSIFLAATDTRNASGSKYFRHVRHACFENEAKRATSAKIVAQQLSTAEDKTNPLNSQGNETKLPHVAVLNAHKMTMTRRRQSTVQRLLFNLSD